uniref:5-hydroxytryptamine receptor 3A-like n=1 Tax=Mastacembelus armatus TaxID=205130 RepID=A0A3Q3KYE6_9TELE
MRLNTLMYMNYLKAFVFYFLFLNSGCVAALKCTSPTPQALFNALNTELFSKQQIRPVQNFSTPLIVSLELTVVEILEVVSLQFSLVFLTQHWKIDGLSWDENECGTKRVSVLRKNLWVPDIQMTELTDEAKFPETPYVYLNNTGYVFDDRPLRAVISCQLLIYTFPFDVQNCTLTFGSHAHFGKTQPHFSVSQTINNTKRYFWVSSNTKLRRPIRYVVNLLIPSCFLITVDLFSFLLPPQSVDRSSFKMTLILGYTVFLLIVNDLLPVTGETTPLINVFFSISLAMMVASLLETVLITNIQFRSSQCSSVPRWLSVLVLRYLAVVVFISNISLRELQNDAPTVKPPLAPSAQLEPILEELRRLTRDLTAIRLHVDKHFQESDATEEWQMVGLIIDRLLFGLYVIFITFSFITIMSLWIWNNSFVPLVKNTG